VRDSAELWYESYYREHRVLSMVPELAHPGVKYKKHTNRRIGCEEVEWWPPLPPTEEARERCIGGYHRHNEQVRALVPAGSLLVFNVKDGWGPLCEFLGRPVPSRPFPRRDTVKSLNLVPSSLAQRLLLSRTLSSTIAIYALYAGCCCCCRWGLRRRCRWCLGGQQPAAGSKKTL